MKVVTAVVNNPEFIELQYYTLKKFFKGDYEFIVFNDAKSFPDLSNYDDPSIREKIENVCKSLGIKCINIPNDHHRYVVGPSARTADSMNYILNYQVRHPDQYLVLDSDMFLINDFYPNRYSKYSCGIVLQSRYNNKVNYLWNGLYYFDMKKVKNVNYMNWNCCTDCDTGGMMQNWLQKEIERNNMPNWYELYKSDKTFHMDTIYLMRHLSSMNWDLSQLPEEFKDNEDLKDFFKSDLRNQNGKFYCEIFDNTFLHYRGGGNWNREGKEIHNYLTNKLKQTLLLLCK
jgi:hypothetical protein